MLERTEDPDGFTVYRSPLLCELRVPHLFTTRRGCGGRELDAGALDGLALGRVMEAAGVERAELVTARQVHGAGVWDVDAALDGEEPSAGSAGVSPAADALVTSRARRVVGVFTADCVPVLLASADGRRVAAVHAGWRGLVAGVIPRALEALVSNEPSASVRELAAAIGPCLSLARFEVGTEVAEQFALAGLADAVRGDLGEKPHVDLRAAAAMQLERAGVARIDATDRCTWEQAGDFPSHRRDVTHGGRERAGRLLALVSPRAG